MSELESFNDRPQELAALPPINFDAFPQPRTNPDTNSSTEIRPTLINIPVNRHNDTSREPLIRQFNASDQQAQIYLRNRPGLVRIQSNIGSGSGFVISADGEVATAAHVVGNDNTVKIRFDDGRTYDATVVSRRATSDVAILRIQRRNPNETFHALTLANSTRDISTNRQVVALGYPGGTYSTHLTSGGFEQSTFFNYGTMRRRLQAENDIRPGNSGGPWIDARTGHVIGLSQSISLISNEKYASTVEDLHELRGNVPPGRLSEYVIPRSLNVPWSMPGQALDLGVTGYLFANRFNQTPTWRGVQAASMPVLGAFNAVSDFAYARNAFGSGTTAERVSASINLGADGLMMSGVLAARSPHLTAALAVTQLVGAGIRFTNHLFSDRRW